MGCRTFNTAKQSLIGCVTDSTKHDTWDPFLSLSSFGGADYKGVSRNIPTSPHLISWHIQLPQVGEACAIQFNYITFMTKTNN